MRTAQGLGGEQGSKGKRWMERVSEVVNELWQNEQEGRVWKREQIENIHSSDTTVLLGRQLICSSPFLQFPVVWKKKQKNHLTFTFNVHVCIYAHFASISKANSKVWFSRVSQSTKSFSKVYIVEIGFKTAEVLLHNSSISFDAY